MNVKRFALTATREAFPMLAVACIAIIGLNMFLVYNTTGHAIAAHEADRSALALQKDLMTITRENTVTTGQSPYKISHIVVAEPLSVSVVH